MGLSLWAFVVQGLFLLVLPWERPGVRESTNSVAAFVAIERGATDVPLM